MDCDVVEINGIEYVPKNNMASSEGLPYCVFRTYSAGVHIGYLKKRNGREATLVNARRLWRWSNAASLSQVALDGCESDKFTVAVPEIILTEVIEVIQCTDKAKKKLDSIEEWKC